jgi:hypothetical protein
MTDVLDSARRILSTTAGRWHSLVDTTPDELLVRPPAPGEWSAAACLKHVHLTENAVFGQRLRAILDGRDLVSFDPSAPRDPEPQRTLGELVTAFTAERDRNLAVLGGLTPPDLDRTSRHPEYGMIALSTVLNTWAAHDLQHTVQAEEALMQAFLPGTGPWRFRFADHELKTPG